eukprot:m.34839 g.34839  ORF g.34839 m.34839 type:complete len:351 (-) comp7377_c0_seq2:1842-2894(-)
MDGTPNPGLPDRDAACSVSPRASAPLSGNEEPTDTRHLSISPHEIRARDEMTACLTLHIESDDGAAPAAMCGICHRFETSLILNCRHEVCRWCSLMHGCGLCGVPIQHRTPIADEDDPEDSLDNNIETSTTLPKSRHESVESPPVSVTPEPESHDQHERQAAPCTICENRRQAAKVTCKNGCEVFTCNSCAHKHKKCFMCNAKLVKVEEDGDDENMFSARGIGCDVCSKRSRVLLLECRMGCQFRVCSDCHSFTKQCCGYPVKSGGEILATNPQRNSIDWRFNPTAQPNVPAELGSRLSVRQDSGTSARLDAERRAQRYMQARRSATTLSQILKPLYADGGFMGYRDGAQ